MKRLRKAIAIFFSANRRSVGKTLEDVANATGFTVAQLTQLEDGKTDWPLCDLIVLVDLYNVRNQFMEMLNTEEVGWRKRNPRRGL